MVAKAPFGMESCEAEVSLLGEEKYSDLYFDETPFNNVAIKDDTYLIVGRRGSGKTALIQYFSFQKQIANPVCIEIHKPEAYQQVLSEISGVPLSRARLQWLIETGLGVCYLVANHSRSQQKPEPGAT